MPTKAADFGNHAALLQLTEDARTSGDIRVGLKGAAFEAVALGGGYDPNSTFTNFVKDLEVVAVRSTSSGLKMAAYKASDGTIP